MRENTEEFVKSCIEKINKLLCFDGDYELTPESGNDCHRVNGCPNDSIFYVASREPSFEGFVIQKDRTTYIVATFGETQEPIFVCDDTPFYIDRSSVSYEEFEEFIDLFDAGDSVQQGIDQIEEFAKRMGGD